MSTERILVHSSIADKFQAALKAIIAKNYDSIEDTPVLVTEQSATRNHDLIKDALDKGAKAIDLFSASKDSGHEKIPTHMRPVVLTDVKESMSLYSDESFGPSVSFYTYETEDEAIRLANDTQYGLSASIFSEDLRAAFRVADRLESGAVHINTMSIHDEFALPHGGVKKSGFGRFNGQQGLEEFLYYKTVTWME